jgi:tRNA(fMet)-specific endonuclease VapC
MSSLWVLDTDTLTFFDEGHSLVCQRVTAHPHQEIAITVMNVEEELSGWYTLLRQAKTADELAHAYGKLGKSIPILARWQILPYTVQAIARYEQLTTMKLNVAKMDLRIAAITLENGGILVTRNLRDFRRVPGLLVEDWSV